MLRKIAAALRAAVAAVASVMRRLEWIWDGAWRLVLSPLRAVLGQPGVQPAEVPDIELEDQVDAILQQEMPPAQADAKLAAVEGQRDAVVEPKPVLELTPEPEEKPEPKPRSTSMQKTAIRAQEMHEAESRRGEAIRAAMLARNLTTLPEEERAALEELDDHDWQSFLDEEKGFRIARQVDELVRAYAQRHALHARLEREGRLDIYPQAAQGLAFGM